MRAGSYSILFSSDGIKSYWITPDWDEYIQLYDQAPIAIYYIEVYEYRFAPVLLCVMEWMHYSLNHLIKSTTIRPTKNVIFAVYYSFRLSQINDRFMLGTKELNKHKVLITAL